MLLFPLCIQINSISTCRNSKAGISRYLIASAVCLSGPALEGFTCNVEVAVAIVNVSVRKNVNGATSVCSNAFNNGNVVAVVIPDIEPSSVGLPMWIDRHVRGDLGISGELVLGTSSVGVVPAVKLLTTCIRICR